MKKITLQDIANSTGYSKSTVARALKGNLNIKNDKREKILQISKELGYKKDPVLSALASHRWKQITKPLGNLAWVLNWESRDQFLNIHTYRDQWEGALDEASTLGYNLEMIWTHSPSIQNNASTINRMLETRNILGLIIPPQNRADRFEKTIPIHWENYSVLRLGFSYKSEEFNTVTDAQLDNTFQAFSSLKDMGCKHIGMFIRMSSNPTDRYYRDRNFIAGFLVSQKAHRTSDIPIHDVQFSDNYPIRASKFEKWVQDEQIDGLICHGDPKHSFMNLVNPQIRSQINELWFSDDTSRPGTILVQNQRRLGSEAVKLLSSMIYTNEQGIPEQPKHLQVGGYTHFKSI